MVARRATGVYCEDASRENARSDAIRPPPAFLDRGSPDIVKIYNSLRVPKALDFGILTFAVYNRSRVTNWGWTDDQRRRAPQVPTYIQTIGRNWLMMDSGPPPGIPDDFRPYPKLFT